MGIEQIISGIVKTIDELVSEVKVKKEEDKDKVDSPLFESEEKKENDVDEAANDFAEAWDTLNKTGKDSKKEKVGSGTDCKKQISEFVSDKRDDVKEEVKDGLSGVTRDFAEAAKAMGGSFSDASDLVNEIATSVSKTAQKAVDLAVGMGSLGVGYLNSKIKDAENEGKQKIEDVKEKAVNENDKEEAKEEINEK